MRRLLAAATLSAGMALAAVSPAFADADPTMNQIYDAAKSGHLDQAQTMLNQVLADHPNSYKAHYVQAELYAREGKIGAARSELATAEKINPALPEFSPRSVQELKSQLGMGAPTGFESQRSVMPERAAPHFPWGTVLILAVVVGVLIMLFRRRQPYAQYPVGGNPGMGGAPGGYGPGPGYGPGYGPAPMGGGGIGSGIAGGLASGLAVGAGVVAGEELAHHFLDGGNRESGVIPTAEADEPRYSNNDMGGSDFGANDSGGGGWDDGSGGGDGGGGGDWS